VGFNPTIRVLHYTIALIRDACWYSENLGRPIKMIISFITINVIINISVQEDYTAVQAQMTVSKGHWEICWKLGLTC
jgi:hypothetical protein